jgi:transcriptional regulator with XRE-family HTH domain
LSSTFAETFLWKEVDIMTFYERLEKLRKDKGISQGDLEKELGFSNGSISKWKKSKPTLERYQKLAEYFGVSVEYLRTGKEPQYDYLYTDENAEFLIEVTKMAKDKDFVERIMKYMSLMSDDRKSIDDMIDFMYEKKEKGEK